MARSVVDDRSRLLSGPWSFCEADRSVGHCLEMIATRSGLLKI